MYVCVCCVVGMSEEVIDWGNLPGKYKEQWQFNGCDYVIVGSSQNKQEVIYYYIVLGLHN